MVALSAKITSCTEPLFMRSIRLSMFSWAAPTPSMGTISPPSTWYTPLNCPVFSSAITSRISATTHSVFWSRAWLLHIPQIGVSLRLWQVLHLKIFSFSTDMASQSCCATVSAWGCSRCRVRRKAVFLPMPGSLLNAFTVSSMSFGVKAWLLYWVSTWCIMACMSATSDGAAIIFCNLSMFSVVFSGRAGCQSWAFMLRGITRLAGSFRA